MTTLIEELGTEPKRSVVIADACVLLDKEVADKGGLSGIAIKTAFKVVKNIKAGFIPEVINALLDDFLGALEPVHTEAKSANSSTGGYIRGNGERTADALLHVTDSRIERANQAIIKKTYSKLRPTAKKHVLSATPRIAEMVDKNLAS